MSKISYLKGALIAVFVLIVVSIGNIGWRNLDNSNKLKNPDDTLTEPVTTNNPKTPEIDTSYWKVYRNAQYRFEVKYPNFYVINNRDVANHVSESRYIAFNSNGDNTETLVTIEVIPVQESQSTSFHIGGTSAQYIDFLKRSNNKTQLEVIEIMGKDVPIFLFKGENPGELGDLRNTVVAILDQEYTTFVIKKTPALELDAEFKGMLKTMGFY